MAIASIETLLALDRYAQIMGIAPPHFNQGVSASSAVFPLTNRCSDVWYQHPWQSPDQISREDVALEIANAEQDLADLLGWWPGPKWLAQEVHEYPQHYRPELYGVGGYNVRYQHKSIKTHYGKVILPGRRATTALDTGVAVAYSDEDGDGYDETATITVAGVTANVCECKVYFAGEAAAQEYEIRPYRTKTLVAGTLTVTFWAWQLLDPDLWEELPTLDFTAIDLDTAGNYVATVDVYREYTSSSVASAVFYWVPTASVVCTSCGGTGCTACELTTQDGCLNIQDAERGSVIPVPGSYDSDELSWAGSAFTVCRDPDQVKLYYYAGDLDNRWRRCTTCEPLSNWWAQTIAYLATARLERPFCNCGNSTGLAEHLRVDLALVGETSRNVSFDLLGNPLGTRRGEVMAWQRISRIVRGGKRGAAAV